MRSCGSNSPRRPTGGSPRTPRPPEPPARRCEPRLGGQAETSSRSSEPSPRRGASDLHAIADVEGAGLARPGEDPEELVVLAVQVLEEPRPFRSGERVARGD